MKEALIHGGGVAALCCAKLLGQKGWRVTLRAPAPAPAPTLVLNAVTVELINHVFDSPPDLFADAHRLYRRGVYWGEATADPVGDAPCVVMRGETLNERLLASVKKRDGARVAFQTLPSGGSPAPEPRASWSVYAGGVKGLAAYGSQPPELRRFGRRRAILAEARLSADADEETCWMEATPAGWLFLAPLGSRRALLQVVVPLPPPDPAAALSLALRATRRIGTLVSDVAGPPRLFDASPGLMKYVCGSRWVAVGSLACAYDPLCGDGTGYAVREAILAAALLDGIERGLPREPCLEHYRKRLTHALHAHLRACCSFYALAGFDDTWRDELVALEYGLRELDEEIIPRDEFGYGLRGFSLVPLAQQLSAAAGRAPSRLLPSGGPDRHEVQ